MMNFILADFYRVEASWVIPRILSISFRNKVTTLTVLFKNKKLAEVKDENIIQSLNTDLWNQCERQ